MPPNRLNLFALRRQRLPRTPPPEPTLSRLATSPEPVTVSRRELLGIAGAAAVALPPGGKQLGSGARGPFRLSAGRERLAFSLGGQERWVIDASRFAGAPKLRHTQSDGRIAIELTGATYPGTDVPADFACVIRRSVVGWRMRIKHAFGGLEAEVPFEAWLTGAEPARAQVKAPGVLCAVGAGGKIEASGGEASFCPDWTLRLEGDGVATVSGLDARLRGDALTIALLASQADSLMAEPPAERTLLSLERGDEAWPLPSLPTPAGTRLAAEGSAFDVVTLETGERDGALAQALVASANGDVPRLRFAPGGDLQGVDGRSAALPLGNPRYGVAFDPGGDDAALMADFAHEPTWVSGGGCTLQVGGGAHVEPFEIARRNGTLSSVRCEPALLSFAAPLPGAVVGPAVPSIPVRVSFVADGDLVAQRPPIGRPPVVRPKPEEETPPAERPPVQPRRPVEPKPPADTRPERPPGGTVLTRPDVTIADLALLPFTVPVLRKDDLLYLTFRFINLKLETGAGKPAQLVRVKPNDTAYIVVHFPPQHIGERAFLEESNDEPTPPPVPSRMAGPSRLVFEVPKDTAAIPYTLPALLDWSNFNLSVAPTALPPPLPVALRPQGRRTPAKVIPRLTPGAVPTEAQPAGPASLSPLRLRVDAQRLLGDFSPRMELASPTISANVLRLLVPGEPQPTETAIELPYRLVLSPNASAGWLHSLTRVARNKRVELWHTRLGVKSQDGTIREDQYAYGWDDDQFRVLQVSEPTGIYDKLHTLRAIWSPDYNPDYDKRGPYSDAELLAPAGFLMSMNARDRCQLVWLMADYRLKECQVRVADTKKLMLSSLGAWLDTRYGYDPLALGHGLSLEEWQHIATMGRDQYVKVVEMGYLFPFGQRAALVKVTERKFEVSGNSSIAYLRQRYYIIVREPEKTYAAPGQRNDGRRMPFRKVTLLTRMTPTLTMTPDVAVPGVGAATQDCFWARVQGEDFQWSFIAEDWDGERHQFTAPLIFAGAANELCFRREFMEKVCTHYNATTPPERTKRPTFGQKIAFADTDGAKPGDTALESETVTFGAETDDPAAGFTFETIRLANQPCFYPTVAAAEVRVPAAVVVTGQNAAVPIKIADLYVNSAWQNAANKGSVFAEMLDKSPLNFPGDKGGGLALPNLNLGGLSRQFGPVGDDLANFAGGNFDPTQYFKGAASKLFGCIDLWEIISGVFGDAEVPGLTIDVDKDADGLPKLIRAKYDWTPQVKDFDPLFKANNSGKTATFQLKVTVEVPVSTTPDITYDSLAKLQNFTIDLYCIIVRFNRLEFTARSGSKPDVGVDIAKVEFGGPLSFVNQLQELLKEVLPGFSIDVTPTGVYIGYEFPIPTIAVGVMSIQNITLGAAITLPFTGDPIRFRFSFCSRENPFLLSVSIFGGGGFFAIELTPGGMQMLEASFEFGGVFAFDIGVASGGAYLMAGIYYKWENGDSTLTGYVKCGGHLSVLGIITISAEFYLGLTYESAGNRCWGQAKLTVEIEILFFSFSVTLTVEREFANSGGGSAYLPTGERFAALGTAAEIASLGRGAFGQVPPTIEETMTAQDWQTYCGTFA
jgi:hypothetical protein